MAYGTISADVIQSSVANTSLGAGDASLMKNRIINGSMVIDQRNSGASLTITNTAANTYTLDRWYAYGNVASKFSVQQNAGSVTPPAGFSNYLGVTSLSAYSVTAPDQFILAQAIEGFNTADFGWGTANAKTVTLSFWAYSSLTGSFSGALRNGAGNYSYPFSYSIPVANTWTQISVTIAGPTAGTWVGATNGVGMQVFFSLGVGSTNSGTAGAWTANAYNSVTGSVSVVGTNGATFYVTGVQLEVGSSATGFEYRQYGQELALCQRYYEIGRGDARGAVNGNNQVGNQINFRVTKRTAPTITVTVQTGSPVATNIYDSSFLFYGTTTENTGQYNASAEL